MREVPDIWALVIALCFGLAVFGAVLFALAVAALVASSPGSAPSSGWDNGGVARPDTGARIIARAWARYHAREIDLRALLATIATFRRRR